MPDAQIKLDPEKILEWEFEYARTTAEQAQDDRTAIMTLYLVLVGGVSSVIAALLQFSPTTDSARLAVIVALICFLLGVTGFFTQMKLVRLRQAWNDSALAMNTIKDYYREQYPDLNRAFRWKTETLPPLGKPWTITFNLVMLVAIIDSVATSVAAYVVAPMLSIDEIIAAVSVAVMFLVIQLGYYFYQLSPTKKWAHRTQREGNDESHEQSGAS